jgi:hypothetical protein
VFGETLNLVLHYATARRKVLGSGVRFGVGLYDGSRDADPKLGGKPAWTPAS